MILRRRHPDGTNHDIDCGPGPVGRAPKRLGYDPIMAVPVAEAAERTGRNRERPKVAA